MSKDSTDLITSPQAGQIINRSARTIHRLVDAGELTPAVKLPGPTGALLFHRADIEALAASRAAIKDAVA